ncbi:MAG: histidine kinase dimerization/phospho-acceptor domain-containing protein [Polaromonas sp.]
MTAAPTPPKASLQRHLLLWVLAAQLAVWGCLVGSGYLTGMHEATELTDGHLAGTAALMVNIEHPQFVAPAQQTGRAVIPSLQKHDYQPSMSVLVWDAAGSVLASSGQAPLPLFTVREGFADLTLGQPATQWRSFSQWNAARTRQVMVLVKADEQADLAEDVAEHVVVPSLLLLPLVTLILSAAIRRGLRPLQALSRDVEALDVGQAGRLQARHPHQEFNAMVVSINQLVGQQQDALERERQLASEIAHELRTPLASIALQAASLRQGMGEEMGADTDPAAQQRAVAQIGADALRAGHVVSQLLSLARASRAGLAQPKRVMDLASWLPPLVADYAQAAWASGHELSLSGPEPQTEPVHVMGHPLLLELALRNLIDNALQHTPRGTAVSVQWGVAPDGSAWLQVADNAAPEVHAPAERLGLGLGHKIVGRVMQVHGGGLVPEVTALGRCYRLTFAAPAAPAASV